MGYLISLSLSIQNFLKYNNDHLQKLPCKIFEPIPLGEGAGVGWMKDADVVQIPDDYTLLDLVQVGLNSTHAAVGVVVRLREELSLLKDMPVLIAVDQVRKNALCCDCASCFCPLNHSWERVNFLFLLILIMHSLFLIFLLVMDSTTVGSHSASTRSQ